MNKSQAELVKSESRLPQSLLVIGYGNELRRDDGVGPAVAAAVEAWQMSGVRAISCHQLTPELAESIAAAEMVVFVDAAVGASPAISLVALKPEASATGMSHAANPQALLELARHVFGHRPRAWWLTIPVTDLGFGEELSAQAKSGIQTALDRIRVLVASLDFCGALS